MHFRQLSQSEALVKFAASCNFRCKLFLDDILQSAGFQTTSTLLLFKLQSFKEAGLGGDPGPNTNMECIIAPSDGHVWH